MRYSEGRAGQGQGGRQVIPPTTADILRMMRDVPAECALYHACADIPGGFERAPDAPAIASAIATGVAAEPDPWGRAALGVVYAAYESSMRACPKSGDAGHSNGTWMLWGVAHAVACDPMRAFPRWLGVVRASEAACSANAPGEALAALASGRCDMGRWIVRQRDELARRLIAGRL
jgi:hypothetical protein